MLRLRPGLRRAWRGPGRVQLGADPAVAVVLEDLTAGDEAVLDDLVEGVDPAELLRRARRRGAAEDAVHHLVSLVRTAGLLARPSPPGARARARATAAEAAAAGLASGGGGWQVLARRAGARVVVDGADRTGTAVAAGLVEAGVGDVVLTDERGRRVAAEDVAVGGMSAADVGRRRTAVAPELLPRWEGHLGLAHPAVVTAPPGPTGPDLVVLTAVGAVAPVRAAALARDDVPHLPVVLRERSAVVGPLVVPGAGACLRCVDLHRSDRDPEWPQVVAQLAHPLAPDSLGEDAVLARLAAALAVAQVVAHLDATPDEGAAPPRGMTGPGTGAERQAADERRDAGAPAPAPDVGVGPPAEEDPALPATRGHSWELALPDGLPVGRRWSPHPRCGCAWPLTET